MKDKLLNRQVTFLTDEQLSQLKRISVKTGAPISTLIRMAVGDYLKGLPASVKR
jgi:Ribbon-helix-helix domain